MLVAIRSPTCTLPEFQQQAEKHLLRIAGEGCGSCICKGHYILYKQAVVCTHETLNGIQPTENAIWKT